jgi:hypothetical protein
MNEDELRVVARARRLWRRWASPSYMGESLIEDLHLVGDALAILDGADRATVEAQRHDWYERRSRRERS